MSDPKTPLSAELESLTTWLREHAPDCGDNSCLFGGRGKGGMRTNGGCRCFKDLPTAKRIYVERLASLAASTRSASAPSSLPGLRKALELCEQCRAYHEMAGYPLKASHAWDVEVKLRAEIERIERTAPTDTRSANQLNQISRETLAEAKAELALADELEAAVGDASITALVRKHRDVLLRVLRGTAQSASPASAELPSAKLRLFLEADSGFESEQEHRITVEQWGAICRILNGTDTDSASPATADAYGMALDVAQVRPEGGGR